MEAAHRDGGQTPKHRGPIPVEEGRATGEPTQEDETAPVVTASGAVHRALVADLLQPVDTGPASTDELRHEAVERALAAAEAQRVRAQHERRNRRVSAWTLAASVTTLAVAIITLVISARS